MHIPNGCTWLKWPFEVTLRPVMTCSLNSFIFFESSESLATVASEFEVELLLSVDRKKKVIFVS